MATGTRLKINHLGDGPRSSSPHLCYGKNKAKIQAKKKGSPVKITDVKMFDFGETWEQKTRTLATHLSKAVAARPAASAAAKVATTDEEKAASAAEIAIRQAEEKRWKQQQIIDEVLFPIYTQNFDAATLRPGAHTSGGDNKWSSKLFWGCAPKLLDGDCWAERHSDLAKRFAAVLSARVPFKPKDGVVPATPELTIGLAQLDAKYETEAARYAARAEIDALFPTDRCLTWRADYAAGQRMSDFDVAGLRSALYDPAAAANSGWDMGTMIKMDVAPAWTEPLTDAEKTFCAEWGSEANPVCARSDPFDCEVPRSEARPVAWRCIVRVDVIATDRATKKQKEVLALRAAKPVSAKAVARRKARMLAHFATRQASTAKMKWLKTRRASHRGVAGPSKVFFTAVVQLPFLTVAKALAAEKLAFDTRMSALAATFARREARRLLPDEARKAKIESLNARFSKDAGFKIGFTPNPTRHAADGKAVLVVNQAFF